MLPQVELAGHSATWRFIDSARMGQWMKDERWRKEGGLLPVRVRSDEVSRRVLGELQRVLSAARDESPAIEEVPVSAESPTPGLEDILSGILMVGRGLRRSEWLAAVVQDLRERPHVLLIDSATCEGPSRGWWEEASGTLSDLRKTDQNAVVTVVVATNSAGFGEVFDFSTGEPLPDLSWLHEATPAMWRAYLHRRIAWESGGDLGLALDWLARRPGWPAEMNEAGLESWLNKVAIADWKSKSEEARNAAVRYAKDISSERSADWIEARQAEPALVGSHLIWKPQGVPGFRLVPWVARALLGLGVIDCGVARLRGELIDSGLAGLVFARCLELEYRARGRARTSGVAPDKALSLLNAFQKGSERSAARYYSPGFPAKPSDPWWMASFGDLLDGIPPSTPRRTDYYRLLGLRNAIAHGHPCCWRALVELRELERSIP